jgi:aminoglycoside phosphotransferase (APT) family kinase protein
VRHLRGSSSTSNGGRTAALHAHLRQLVAVVDRAAVLSLWDRALSARPWSGAPLWLHGDLDPGNLLVIDGRLSGVIDFVDLTCGVPATDLSVLWMLPRSIPSGFEAWLGKEPDAWKMRARGWALALGLAFLTHSRDDAAVAARGRTAIDAALSEP